LTLSPYSLPFSQKSGPLDHPQQKMNHSFSRIVALLLMTAVPFTGFAAQKKTYQEKLVERLESCEYSLEVIMSKPETAIPAAVLADAKGIVIVHQYRVGFIIGGQAGSAVMIARNPQSGQWGPPVFLNPGGVNLGFQAGGQEINTVFLLMSEEAISLTYSGRFDFGADAVAVAGPKNAERDAFDLYKSPVLVYNSLGGLYAGASIKTGWLSPDNKANREFYQTTFTMPEISMSGWFDIPAAAQPIVERVRSFEQGS
jgi:lipid-binding SYLF domain-containing protein